MISPNYKRLYVIAAAVLLAQAAGVWLQNLWTAQHTPLLFDDAYMFARYAANVRHGLGLSWNPDGVHTYGPTSLLWTLVVVVMSYLPIGSWKMLTLASWLCSIGAVAAMAWAVAVNARSWAFMKTWRVLPLVVLPLAGNAVFVTNEATGMETMLAAMLAAVFLGSALSWRRGDVRPELVGVAGFLLFLTRPEAGIVVVLLPVMLFFLAPGATLPKGNVVRLLSVFFACVALELLACKLYFKTPLPLSFYMKGHRAYEGYGKIWHPELLLLAFLGACELYLLALVLLGRRRDWRLIICCLMPALAVFVYLGTVTQIMGQNSRYYVPYFAFLIVPALLVIDRWLTPEDTPAQELWPGNTLVVRSCLAAAIMACFVALSSQGVLKMIRQHERNSHFEYEPAVLRSSASIPLPTKEWQPMMLAVTDLLVAPLPKGVTIAATEVGYLGNGAQQVNVIDIAGLNDTDIALHGFRMDALLERKPDIIWMPHLDYTYQRGLMLTDPSLLQKYDLYAGAANYGLAIRKDSPFRPQIDKQMQVFWNAVYPGYRMGDYLVTSSSWTGQKFKVVGD